jgi:hypothetical protein
MLSQVEATGQEQSARAADPVPIWECVKGDIEERGDRWVRRSHLYEERKGGASHQLDRSPRSKPIVSFCSRKFLLCVAATVLIFFIANLLYLLRFERVDNLGAYRIPPETGLLIPSDSVNGGRIARQKQSPARRCRC